MRAIEAIKELEDSALRTDDRALESACGVFVDTYAQMSEHEALTVATFLARFARRDRAFYDYVDES